ncbi:cytochrome c oxidase subunit 3, partial [Salmonella sp. zj-f54]
MSANRANAPYYFVPGPSRHPITASLGLLIVLLSSAAWVNAQPWAPWTFLVGLLWFLFVLRAWFADAISESETGKYG